MAVIPRSSLHHHSETYADLTPEGQRLFERLNADIPLLAGVPAEARLERVTVFELHPDIGSLRRVWSRRQEYVIRCDSCGRNDGKRIDVVTEWPEGVDPDARDDGRVRRRVTDLRHSDRYICIESQNRMHVRAASVQVWGDEAERSARCPRGHACELAARLEGDAGAWAVAADAYEEEGDAEASARCTRIAAALSAVPGEVVNLDAGRPVLR